MQKKFCRFYPPWFLVRILIGAVFIYSGGGKLMSPLAETRALFYEYALLPAFAVPWIALLFPWVELFTGSFLVVGYMTRISALFIAGFTFCFIGLLGSEFILKGHFPQDCGCFAGSWKLPTAVIFFMDMMNFCLTVQLVRIKDHPWSLDQWIGNYHEWDQPRRVCYVVIGIALTSTLTVLALGLRSRVPFADSFVLSQSSVQTGVERSIVKLQTDKAILSPKMSVETVDPKTLVFAQSLPLKEMGAADAPVEIVEYTDFQCPACQAAKAVIGELIAKRPGVIKVIFKHNPLPGHSWARPAHRAAECAHAQGAFWSYHTLLYAHQKEWSIDEPSEVFMRYAESLRLNMPQFQGCLNSSEPDRGVEADVAEAKQQAIRATPTFFINGERVVGSQELRLRGEEIIEKHLKDHDKQ